MHRMRSLNIFVIPDAFFVIPDAFFVIPDVIRNPFPWEEWPANPDGVGTRAEPCQL